MSSPLSPQLADGLAGLGAAAVQVAEDSLFTYAEPWEAQRTARLLGARPAAEAWLAASIAFSGPFDGTVRLSLPRALSADLAGAFCGVTPQSLDTAQVADFAGELANMVCGLWLTQTHRADGFALTAPVVTDSTLRDVSAAVTEAGALGIVLNATPLLLVLTAGSPVPRS